MKCRHCKSPAQSSDFLGNFVENKYLFRCQKSECGRFFWHRRILSEFDLKTPDTEDNKNKEQQICDRLQIPSKLKMRFVYVIKLSRKTGEKVDTVYVGETGHHPLRRYLQHLRGYKSGKKYVKRRGKYLLFFEDNFQTVTESRNREKELALNLDGEYLVYGGH